MYSAYHIRLLNIKFVQMSQMNQTNQQQTGDQIVEPIYLFLSRDCANCVELIKEIQKKEELIKKIQVVQVENTPRLPEKVTHVPSIMIGEKVVVGSNCFSWVQGYGELEAGSFTGKGFNTSNFDYIDGTQEEASTTTFSFIDGSQNSQGINSQEVNKMIEQENNSKKNGKGGGELESLQNARAQETKTLMSNQPGPGGMNQQRSF